MISQTCPQTISPIFFKEKGKDKGKNNPGSLYVEKRPQKPTEKSSLLQLRRSFWLRSLCCMCREEDVQGFLQSFPLFLLCIFISRGSTFIPRTDPTFFVTLFSWFKSLTLMLRSQQMIYSWANALHSRFIEDLNHLDANNEEPNLPQEV